MVSGTLDRYLQKGVALPLMYEKMEPNLQWANLLNIYPSNDQSFTYLYDTAGKSSDSKKETPPKHSFPGKFPEIDKSRKNVASEILQEQGFAIRIPRAIMLSTQRGKAEVMDAFETAGFWMAEAINSSILSVLQTGGQTGAATVTAVWSAATATPALDLLTLGKTVRRVGYPFRLTDSFVHETNWYELADKITFYDADYDSKAKIYGVMDVSKDTIYVPLAKTTVHLVMDGIDEGYILSLDKNNKAAELHYFNDPEYSVAKVSYMSTDAGTDGKPKSVTVPNMGIHFQKIYEEDTHDTLLRFWYNNKTVVTKPYGVYYNSGI